ncbi:two-component system sensor kinase [Treponema primitia ZAS-2]|uniref:histidine kinase n=1 Tax=Treponema primitia (strain ATCC BAA-887 / DSM 12427 / ZAS-2) TaxID=545694 RepID=F5YH23_TREPZ|nr:ATP-binding protein [Treponema primitia]AEF85241.1 two-component system sensor kinase [Treponema primitia ZAS-2]
MPGRTPSIPLAQFPAKAADLSAELTAYFSLLWLFVGIISVLVLLLCYLYFSMKKAQQMEEQNLAFSHLIIAGQEQERQRISRELHDTVLPEIRFSPAADKIREICADLMPPDFERFSFIDSLSGLMAKFGKKTGIECVLNIQEGLDLGGIKAVNQLHLYRMVQEALNNIEKHSGAQKAFLIARRQNRNILLCVSDDGAGLSPGIPQGGLGMRTMRQRAAIIGATFTVRSEKDNGFMVCIEVPEGDDQA